MQADLRALYAGSVQLPQNTDLRLPELGSIGHGPRNLPTPTKTSKYMSNDLFEPASSGYNRHRVLPGMGNVPQPITLLKSHSVDLLRYEVATLRLRAQEEEQRATEMRLMVKGGTNHPKRGQKMLRSRHRNQLEMAEAKRQQDRGMIEAAYTEHQLSEWESHLHGKRQATIETFANASVGPVVPHEQVKGPAWMERQMAASESAPSLMALPGGGGAADDAAATRAPPMVAWGQ